MSKHNKDILIGCMESDIKNTGIYDARRVFLENGEIHLTQTEYNILSLLFEHCGKAITYKRQINLPQDAEFSIL